MDKSLQDRAIDIKGKKYVLVSDRISYFNNEYLNGRIITKLISKPEDDRVVIKAIVTPDVENKDRYFTGYSQALWGDGYINKTSAIENCETSAVGRALGIMGIGIVDGIASVDEINKAQTQAKAQMQPRQVSELSALLESKNITEPNEKQTIVNHLAGHEPLNTSGVARLMKAIEDATPEALQIIIGGNN